MDPDQGGDDIGDDDQGRDWVKCDGQNPGGSTMRFDSDLNFEVPLRTHLENWNAFSDSPSGTGIETSGFETNHNSSIIRSQVADTGSPMGEGIDSGACLDMGHTREELNNNLDLSLSGSDTGGSSPNELGLNLIGSDSGQAGFDPNQENLSSFDTQFPPNLPIPDPITVPFVSPLGDGLPDSPPPRQPNAVEGMDEEVNSTSASTSAKESLDPRVLSVTDRRRLVRKVVHSRSCSSEANTPSFRDIATEASQAWKLGKMLGMDFRGDEGIAVGRLEELEKRDIAMLCSQENPKEEGVVNLSQ